MSSFRILAISGSLRANSSNTNLLRALVQRSPDGVTTELFAHLESIPAFNPDRESDQAPAPVAALKTAISGADIVAFSTPEYAHGVPGVLKNALDWLVGSGELYRKPAALLKVSERGQHAHASLKEVLVTMGALIVRESIVDPASARDGFDAEIAALRQAVADIPAEA